MSYKNFSKFRFINRIKFINNIFSALCIAMIFYSVSYSQTPDTIWNKSYGGQIYLFPNSVRQTNNGGFITTGFIQPSNSNSFYAWLINTDSNGDTLWTKYIGSGSISYYGTSVTLSNDYQFILSGYTYDFGPDTLNPFIAKIDTNGNILWTKVYNNISMTRANSIQKTSDGGFILTGSSLPAGSDTSRIWLCKTDENGNVVWSNTYDYNFGSSIKQTSDGGYIAVGRTLWAAHDNSWDACMVKTDADGNMVWEKELGGDGNYYDDAKDVQQTNNGNYIVVGFTEAFGSAGFYDLWLFKLDGNGDTMWTKTFGGTHDDEGYSINKTSDGNYIVLGITSSFSSGVSPDAWLIKVNADGESLWDETIGGSGSDYGYSVRQTNDGGYIITGKTESYGQGGIWLSKVGADITSVHNNISGVISDYRLSQNYPNPFNPSTTIKYQVPTEGPVELSVYNVLGQKVAALVNEDVHAGSYEIQFNGLKLASGIYLYKLHAGSFNEIKKMILLK